MAVPATPTFTYAASEYDFILSVFSAVNNHNWRALAPYVAYPCNYFGERYMTMDKIRRDMIADSYRYGNWRATYYPSSFSRQVSAQYSQHWDGPMIYDEINVCVEVDEPGVRVHRATEHWTVGYTNVGGNLRIYALVFRLL